MIGFPDRLDRLVIGAVARACVLVGFGFLALDWVFSLLDELRGRSGDYGLVAMLRFIALTTPRRLQELVPYIALLGALGGLSVLAAHAELVVMRAAGRSLLRINLAVLVPALVLVAVGVVLGEGVAPHSEARAQAAKALARGGAGAVELRVRGGIWHRDGDGMVTQARALDPTGGLIGVTQYQIGPDGVLAMLREARRAFPLTPTELDAPGRSRWLLESVTEVALAGERVGWENHASRTWDADADAGVFRRAALLAPNRLPIAELRVRVEAEADAVVAARYRLALWQRLAQPFSVVALVLMGTAFVFGPLREFGMGWRLAAGIGLGLAFRALQELLGPASLVFGFSPLWAVGIPVLLAFGVAAMLMRRAG